MQRREARIVVRSIDGAAVVERIAPAPDHGGFFPGAPLSMRNNTVVTGGVLRGLRCDCPPPHGDQFVDVGLELDGHLRYRRVGVGGNDPPASVVSSEIKPCLGCTNS
jgi:hypothetical protein